MATLRAAIGVTGQRRIRVLVAKPGLDGHDRGAQVVARALMDAGMEVIYTGIRQTPEMIVHAALQEDVDCVGLSMLSGGHVEHTEEIINALSAAGAADVAVIVGGIIPAHDIPTLRDLGVAGVFGPGSTTADMVAAVNTLFAEKTRAARLEI
jgi:methylmalonyl-CoA mutase C-terminal domain/subunit